MSCEDAIFNKLRERGFRLTPQREMVLSAMHKTDGFATVDEIFAGVHALSTAVDVSTVYRTLDLLKDFDVVAVIDLGDDQRRYKLSGMQGPQLHLVCRSCGAVIGLDQDLQEPLAALVREHTGFEVELGRLSVPGLCVDCSEGHAAVRPE